MQGSGSYERAFRRCGMQITSDNICHIKSSGVGVGCQSKNSYEADGSLNADFRESGPNGPI